MREAKAKKAQEKEEWLEDQRTKQKKILKQEKKQRPKKPKKVRPPSPVYESSSESEDEPDQYGQHQQIFHKLTAGEIRAIQRDAIQDYDQLRKMRKQKTQQILAAQEQERQMRSNMREVNVPDNDPWSSAFNFS